MAWHGMAWHGSYIRTCKIRGSLWRWRNKTLPVYPTESFVLVYWPEEESTSIVRGSQVSLLTVHHPLVPHALSRLGGRLFMARLLVLAPSCIRHRKCSWSPKNNSKLRMRYSRRDEHNLGGLKGSIGNSRNSLKVVLTNAIKQCWEVWKGGGVVKTWWCAVMFGYQSKWHHYSSLHPSELVSGIGNGVKVQKIIQKYVCNTLH